MSPLKREDIVIQNPAVLCTELDDGDAVLLNLDTKFYYGLNETGLRAWQLIDGSRTVAQIAETITQEYEVDQAQAENSTLQLLQELEAENLVLVGKPKVSGAR